MANRTLMKNKGKNIYFIYSMLLFAMLFSSCAGGDIAQNGIFEKEHKELKESLVGSWQLIDQKNQAPGQEMYQFYKENKKVKLKVLGVEREMERFFSADGVTFSFEYRIEEDKKIYVLGQFRSYERRELLATQELPNGVHQSLSMIKRQADIKAQ